MHPFMLHLILSCWHLLMDAAIYILFGLVVAVLIRVFLNPFTVAHHLGSGRFASVFKASLIGCGPT